MQFTRWATAQAVNRQELLEVAIVVGGRRTFLNSVLSRRPNVSTVARRVISGAFVAVDLRKHPVAEGAEANTLKHM